MSWVLEKLSRLVTAQPVATLLVLLVITIALGAGATRLAPRAADTVFLPKDSRIATATDKIEVLFGGSTDTITATLIFRGNVLTPDGLAQIDRVLNEATSDPRVSLHLAPAAPVFGPTLLIAAALGTNDFASLSQQQIDQVVAEVPLRRLVGTDADGTQVAISNVRLLKDIDGDGDVEDDADGLAAADLAIRGIAEAGQGPLEGSSLSPATLEEETDAATGGEMLVLMGIALAVIALLLVVFTRSVFDLILSLVGLVVTIVWVVGAQGWLGPNGAGLIGAPNTLTTMVPIILIGLVVDYAIQTVGLYREQRNAGHEVRAAARLGLRAVIIPLSLAAVTTIVSFLTNIASPIPANGDFGVVAGIGVGAGLIVMLALTSSSRALFDRWRESRGSLTPVRPISGAIPGVGPAVEALGGLLARKPAPFLVVVGIVTVLLGAAATQVETEFDTRDFLPSGGDAIRNIDTLDAAFGGSTDLVTVLIEAEITDDRTVRNIFDFSLAFSDDLRRPEGVVSEIQASLGLLLFDWITDEGTPGDKYDAQLLDMFIAADEFRIDPPQIQAIVDHLEELDPDGFGQVANDNPNGPDTLLIQFQALTGDQERAERMVNDIRGLWFGGRNNGDVRRGYRPRSGQRDDRKPDGVDSDDHSRRVDHPLPLFLDHREASGARLHRGRSHCARAVLGPGNDGAARDSVQRDNGADHGVVHRNRSGLYDPHNPPVRGGVRAHTRPGGRSAADSRDNRLRPARFGADHRARLRGSDFLVANAVPAVRHRHRDHNIVRVDRRHRGGTASDDHVGCVPELSPAERRRARGARVRRRSVRAFP